MGNRLAADTIELVEAFRSFNSASGELAGCYRELQERVRQLGGELAAVREARGAEQAQTERLATRLRALLEALPAGVVLLDVRGRIEECNPAARAMLGTVAHRGALWREVVAAAFASRVDDGPDVSLASGRRVHIATCSLGAEPGQILLMADVTETRELRESLARFERRATVGNLAASLAHQIRTPLASALLYASSLRAGEHDDRAHACARIIERLRHLERLVEDMLCFARHGNFERGTVSVQALHDAIEASCAEHLVAGRLTLSVEQQVLTEALNASIRALVSALDNLIANAFEVGAGHVHVHLARSTDRCIVMRVDDDGPGMPESVRERAFEPFFTTRGRGTGLGLAIVQAVVDAHGGSVRVPGPGVDESTGCTFLVELPLA